MISDWIDRIRHIKIGIEHPSLTKNRKDGANLCYRTGMRARGEVTGAGSDPVDLSI